jgi:hypothetical protein
MRFCLTETIIIYDQLAQAGLPPQTGPAGVAGYVHVVCCYQSRGLPREYDWWTKTVVGRRRDTRSVPPSHPHRESLLSVAIALTGNRGWTPPLSTYQIQRKSFRANQNAKRLHGSAIQQMNSPVRESGITYISHLYSNFHSNFLSSAS